jgi:hypothetical protein
LVGSSGSFHHVFWGHVILSSFVGSFNSLSSSGLSLSLNLFDEGFDLIFVCFQEWADCAFVNNSSSIGLWGHKENKEKNSND